MKKALLLGWGPQEWTIVKSLAVGMTCAWADYGGFHVAECPEMAPPYSHLWGWSANGRVLLRVRIDGAYGIVGALCLPGDSDGGFPPLPSFGGAPTLVEEVEIRESDMMTWGEDEQRVAAQSGGVLPGSVRSFEVLTPMPITFIGSIPRG